MTWYTLAQLEDKKYWEMTQEEFVNYHKTGHIPSESYQKYKTVEGLNWLTRERHPILHSSKEFNGRLIEFRKSGEKLKYTAQDEDGNIRRNEHGDAMTMTDEEVAQKGLNTHDAAITAFDGDVAVGLASDEFGTDGIWVVEEYQQMGIGTYLLMALRDQFKEDRRVGQMTYEGVQMTKNLHKKYVERAMEEGHQIPLGVLAEYPELQERTNNELV